MVKSLFLLVLILLISSLITAQTDWEYVGDYNGSQVYYIKSSVSRGAITYVVVVLKPIISKTDDEGNNYEYLTLKCIFRTNNKNEVKCIVSNRIYYYEDKSYRKPDFPNIELSLNYNRIINDLYNKIK